jgi:hypothetical protein
MVYNVLGNAEGKPPLWGGFEKCTNQRSLSTDQLTRDLVLTRGFTDSKASTNPWRPRNWNWICLKLAN